MTHPRQGVVVPAGTLAAMQILGECYRGDWSAFDGRTLRFQLDTLAQIGRVEATGGPDAVKGALAAFYAEADICLKCIAWTDNCRCQ